MNEEQKEKYDELISKYEFNVFQMAEIRVGLLNGLDVSNYLNPNIDWIEMRRIRLELENNNE